jgi:hypothetical protein
MDEIATPGPPSRVRMLSVHFAPGGRTRAGDTVQAEAGEWHWHGGGPGTFMTHLAVQEADEDGQTAYWGEHVTDDEYRGA